MPELLGERGRDQTLAGLTRKPRALAWPPFRSAPRGGLPRGRTWEPPIACRGRAARWVLRTPQQQLRRGVDLALLWQRVEGRGSNWERQRQPERAEQACQESWTRPVLSRSCLLPVFIIYLGMYFPPSSSCGHGEVGLQGGAVATWARPAQSPEPASPTQARGPQGPQCGPWPQSGPLSQPAQCPSR